MAIWSKEVFARNLKEYMDRRGKTQKEMAEIVGVAQSTFNEWLKAKKYPRIDKIEMLANYFGIMKSDLIEDKSNQEEPVSIDGLPENVKTLAKFAMTVPEDKAAMVLRVMKSILEDD